MLMMGNRFFSHFGIQVSAQQKGHNIGNNSQKIKAIFLGIWSWKNFCFGAGLFASLFWSAHVFNIWTPI